MLDCVILRHRMMTRDQPPLTEAIGGEKWVIISSVRPLIHKITNKILPCSEDAWFCIGEANYACQGEQILW